jgi:hypothetical protein
MGVELSADVVARTFTTDIQSSRRTVVERLKGVHGVVRVGDTIGVAGSVRPDEGGLGEGSGERSREASGERSRKASGERSRKASGERSREASGERSREASGDWDSFAHRALRGRGLDGPEQNTSQSLNTFLGESDYVTGRRCWLHYMPELSCMAQAPHCHQPDGIDSSFCVAAIGPELNGGLD